MQPKDLKKDNEYRIPGCLNVFVFGGRYSTNRRCFTRQDGERFMGREFIEFNDGVSYLNIKAVKE